MIRKLMQLCCIFPLVVLSAAEILAASSDPERPVDVIKSLYQEYGVEGAGKSLPDEELIVDQPIRILNRYFDRRLSKLLYKNRQFEIKTGELGSVDFDILYGSQDPYGIDNIYFRWDKRRQSVTVSYDQNGERNVMEIDYVMILQNDKWKIKDIVYKQRKSAAFPKPSVAISLLDLLSNYGN